jgi:hypothetical protein
VDIIPEVPKNQMLKHHAKWWTTILKGGKPDPVSGRFQNLHR